MQLQSIEFYAGEAKRNSPVSAKAMDMGINLTDAEVEKNLLRINFEYTVVYQPDKSHLRLNGLATFIGPEAEKSFDEWKKTKKITGKHGEEIFNTIYYHSSIDGMLVARAFGLAAPINLPTVKFDLKKKK